MFRIILIVLATGLWVGGMMAFRDTVSSVAARAIIAALAFAPVPIGAALMRRPS